MSFSKSLEPFYCIMDKEHKYYVNAVYKRDILNNRTVEVAITPATNIKVPKTAMQTNKLSDLAETLHSLNLAIQIKELHFSTTYDSEPKEFEIVKIEPKIEGTSISSEEIVAAVHEVRMAAQAARQEKINIVLAKLDASKLTDFDVNNLIHWANHII